MEGSIQLDGGPSRLIRIVFHEAALIHMQESDQNFLRSIFEDAGDKIRPLDQLSRQFKTALLAVAGPCAKNQLGYKDSTASCSRSPLKLSHFSNPTFVLTHVSELPSDTQCMSSICKTGDHIVYDQIKTPPYFQSDLKAVKPTGALDFAVSVLARDLVWVDHNLCLASQQYLWECQYLAELRPNILTRLLCDPQLLACIKYEATSNAPFHALEAIAGEASNNEVKIVRRCSALIRPGCGVALEVPLQWSLENSLVHYAYGTVVRFESRAGVDVDYIVVQLHLCRENLPCSVLSRISPGELIQTNIRVTVPAEWVTGTFRISPALLYTATHISEESEDPYVPSFKDKIVVCDAVIGEPDNMPHSNLGVLARVKNGQVPMTLRRMAPFPAECALAFLHHQHAVHCGGLYPPAIWYQAHLADIVKSFAFQKTAQHLRSTKDMHTMHPRIPGAALMELLYLKLDARYREVAVSNGNLIVKVGDLASLIDVFGIPIDKFNFIPQGHGIVKFHGPFVFKWSMYDTLDQTGPLEGSASISVGAYTEYDRMGSGVVKSSKCHPDSIKAQTLKSKRVRGGSAESENQPPEQPSRSELKRASLEAKATQAIMERMNRAMKRLGAEALGSSFQPDETHVTKPSQSGPEDCFIVESD